MACKSYIKNLEEVRGGVVQAANSAKDVARVCANLFRSTKDFYIWVFCVERWHWVYVQEPTRYYKTSWQAGAPPHLLRATIGSPAAQCGTGWTKKL